MNIAATRLCPSARTVPISPRILLHLVGNIGEFVGILENRILEQHATLRLLFQKIGVHRTR